jgi:hypothetical protein
VIHVDDAPPGGIAYCDLLADREQFDDLSQPGDLFTLMYTSGLRWPLRRSFIHGPS